MELGEAKTKTRVIVAGAAGRMGLKIVKAVHDNPQMTLVGVFEHPEHPDVGKEIGNVVGFINCGMLFIKSSFKEVLADAGGADVVIDFTTPESTRSLLLAVAEHNDCAGVKKLAMVIGTTQLSDETTAMMNGMSSLFPCVYAPNMAVGVNVLFKLVEKTAAILGDAYNIEIVELHHNKKKDAPSGTAMKLGEIAANALKRLWPKVCMDSRSGLIGERTVDEIGIQTVRGGDIVGEHTVYFCGPGERIEITHRAHSRDNFVGGATNAAEWIVNQENGLYDMLDVLGLQDF